jgi:hypothetical protein
MSPHFLESAYWISQIVLAIVAIGAAVAAFVQIRTYKLFELLKYLESPEIRSARRTVIREIYLRRNEDWWTSPKDGERLERAASDVCASYDILGRMIEFDRLERVYPSGGYANFFRRHWARSIVDNHDALDRFLTYRRQRTSDAYSAFSRLANAARVQAKIIGTVPLQSI